MKPLSNRNVVIFGIGEVAEVIEYYLRTESEYKVVGFTVDRVYATTNRLFGLPVVAFEDVERTFPAATHDMYVAMSFNGLNAPRKAKCEEAERMGYRLLGHVSPKAEVWRGFFVLPNTFIMSGNIVQPYTQIGRNTILWNGNHIGHHTRIESDCFLASHVVVSGHVHIGERSFLGVNATVRDNVAIGNRCVIGAGALVLHDVLDDSVVRGKQSVPAPIAGLQRI